MPSAHSKCKYVVDRSFVPEKEMKTKYEFTVNQIITIDFKNQVIKLYYKLKMSFLKSSAWPDMKQLRNP